MRAELGRHLRGHVVVLACVALISYWGEGAAFLILYAGLLFAGLLWALLIHAVSRIWKRAAGELPSFLPWRATFWLLRGVWVLIGAALLGGLTLGTVASLSEPIGSFPGGVLSGEVVTAAVHDWSFLDEFELVQLEVAPANPRSMNVHVFVHDGTLYIGADFYFPFKRWVHAVAEDERVRMRARGSLYPLRAVRITEDAEVARIQSALELRLALWRGLDPETTPGFQTEVWMFRMDPR